MRDSIKQLNILDKDAKNFLFTCFDYKKVMKPRIYYASFQEVAEKLRSDNDAGYCVYVTVNELNGEPGSNGLPSRKKKNVSRCRAVWVEDDSVRTSPRDDFPMEPSLIIESSSGKFHYYWATSTIDIPEWDSVMRSMVTNWGCDPSARDAARVLRLAGYLHNKSIDKAFLTRVVANSGAVYDWKKLKSCFGSVEEKAKKGGNLRLTGYDEKATLEAILTSKNYHNSLTSIAMSLANKGVSEELIVSTLQGLMNSVPKNKRREEWKDRASDAHLLECAKSAIDKVLNEEADEIINPNELNDEYSLKKRLSIEYPPGDMGKLCKEIHDMAPHPNKIIAITASIGLIAGICGRKYNVSDMGLNLYITILADTGIGKANLKDSINKALRLGGPYGNGISFLGKARFTGPKPLFKLLSDGLSRVCVLEEAGLIGESKVGDISGISRATLDLYTSSGKGKYAGNEGYSSDDESIPILHSPALTLISVSTPGVYLKVLKSKSAELSGELARMWILRSLEPKSRFNRKRRKTFSKRCESRILSLINTAKKTQYRDNELTVIDLALTEQMIADNDKWVERENKYRQEGETLCQTQCSRAWAKIVKLAAVVSVFNGKDHVGDEEYEWATSCVKQELNFIIHTFTHDSSSNLEELTRNHMAPAIVKCLKGTYTVPNKVPPPKFRKLGMFSRNNIRQALLNSSAFRELEENRKFSSGKSGVDLALDYMVANDYLRVVDPIKAKRMGSKFKKVYQITNEFKLLTEMD